MAARSPASSGARCRSRAAWTRASAASVSGMAVRRGRSELLAFGGQLDAIAEGVAHVEAAAAVDRRLVDDLDAVLQEMRLPGVDVIHDECRVAVPRLRHARARLDVQLRGTERVPDAGAVADLGRARHFAQPEHPRVERAGALEAFGR